MSTVSCCKDNVQMNLPIFGGHFEIFCKIILGENSEFITALIWLN